MNQYQPSTPRAALAMGAVALTAIVLNLAIVVPATLEADGQGPRTAAASEVTMPAPAEDVIFPARADLDVRASDLVKAADSGTTSAAKPVAVAKCPHAKAKTTRSHAI